MKEDLNNVKRQILEQEDNLDKFVNDLYYFSTLLEILKKDFKNHLADLNILKKAKKITLEEYQTNLKILKNLYKTKISELKRDIIQMADLCTFTFEKNIAFKKEHNLAVLDDLIKINSEIKSLNKKVSLEQASIREVLKNEKQKIKKPLGTKNLILISMVSLPLMIIGTLLINYLIYFPKIRNESFDLAKKEYLVALIIVLITLLIIIGYFILMLKVTRKTYMDREKNIFKITTIGFVGSFLDTIGVGSFAVATAGLKAGKIVKNDALLPGTLNIGLGIPNLIAGTIFVAAINVQVLTLMLLVLGAILGSFIGAELTKRISAKHISLTMAIVLAIVVILMILMQLNLLPTSGNKTGLSGWQLGLAFILFIIYGGLQAFGIGLYAPALATIALLGMDIKVAFPIMTLASGYAVPIAAYSYYKNNKYQPKTSFGLMLGGALGVVLAFLTVFVGIEVGLNVKPAVFTNYLKWLAVIVVFYVSIMLLLSYLKIRKKPNPNIAARNTIFSIKNYSQWNEKLVNHLDDYLVSYYDKRQFYNNLINKSLEKETKKWK
ncbi:TSUP family transporter [Spiroplasma endosymbiont of Polydrusus pterygomalis]|uniref:sulfite exporter TauE/SafE family protein n=1 Tax=Spiroplasma endosymbiont of Polydrusus pterygomalis TaxID=3139327 RepID=UPI003CCB47BD